jgi:hypothetical protein
MENIVDPSRPIQTLGEQGLTIENGIGAAIAAQGFAKAVINRSQVAAVLLGEKLGGGTFFFLTGLTGRSDGADIKASIGSYAGAGFISRHHHTGHHGGVFIHIGVGFWVAFLKKDLFELQNAEIRGGFV